jgi:hypothetical protein
MVKHIARVGKPRVLVKSQNLIGGYKLRDIEEDGKIIV